MEKRKKKNEMNSDRKKKRRIYAAEEKLKKEKDGVKWEKVECGWRALETPTRKGNTLKRSLV